MKKYFFSSLEEARLFCGQKAKQGFACDIFETVRKRRRIKITRISVSYLRRVKKKRRRIRIRYVREVRSFVRTAETVFQVTLEKYAPWKSLKSHIESVQKKYGIKNKHVDYPARYLKWLYAPDLYWAWSRRFPPYRGLGYFVKVEIWAVVSRNEGTPEEEFFIWSQSRARGLDIGVSWDEILKIKSQLESDFFKMIERKSHYLALKEFIGFAVYPRTDWYYQTLKSKKHLAKYYRS